VLLAHASLRPPASPPERYLYLDRKRRQHGIRKVVPEWVTLPVIWGTLKDLHGLTRLTINPM